MCLNDQRTSSSFEAPGIQDEKRIAQRFPKPKLDCGSESGRARDGESVVSTEMVMLEAEDS